MSNAADVIQAGQCSAQFGEQKLEGVDPFTLNHEIGEYAESDTIDRDNGKLSYREQNISDVEREAQRIRVRDEARALVAAEKGAQSLDAEPVVVQSLEELAALPPEPPGRVEGLMAWQSSLLLVAMMKTGKTTWLLNLVWSLLTGQPFLGRFQVRPVEGAIVFLNYELSPAMFTRWALDLGIPANRFHVVNLRGKPNPLSYDKVRQTELARQLKALGTETIIIDPFSVAYPGESENDPGEVRNWLEHVNHWAREEVGALDLIIADHMGKAGGETARGASSKQDWADSIVQLVRGSGDDENTRYMKAFGRDVDVPEDELQFDPETRRLTLTGNGSRRDSNAGRAIEQMKVKVADYFQANPDEELSGNRLFEEVGGQRGQAQKAAAALAAAGVLTERAGKRNARLFSLRKEQVGNETVNNDDLSRPIPTYHGDKTLTYPDLSLRGQVNGDRSQSSPIPAGISQNENSKEQDTTSFPTPGTEGPSVYPNNTYCPNCQKTFGPNAAVCPDCKGAIIPPGVEVPQ